MCWKNVLSVALMFMIFAYSGVPRNFVQRGGSSTNSVEDREWGSGGGSPLPPSQGFWRQL